MPLSPSYHTTTRANCAQNALLFPSVSSSWKRILPQSFGVTRNFLVSGENPEV